MERPGKVELPKHWRFWKGRPLRNRLEELYQDSTYSRTNEDGYGVRDSAALRIQTEDCATLIVELVLSWS